jgi:hypothetical protein
MLIKTSREKKVLISVTALPFVLAAVINLYFVHAGWHGKIPGYLILWAAPCGAVLDSSLADLVDSFLHHHVASHSLVPGIVVFIWMPAFIYSAVLSVSMISVIWIKAKLAGSSDVVSTGIKGPTVKT